MTDNELIEKARTMLERSYAPYSHFKVGAAILTEDGRVFTGCNVENASYGGTICAERTAAVKAVSEGAAKFKAVAIVSEAGILTYPCGICRQFLSEFGDESMRVILCDKDGNVKTHTLGELMPHGFTL